MTSAHQITLAMIAALLLTASPALAYHWDDEEENERFMTAAGDENVLVDGGECFNATAQMQSTHCVVLYGHVFDLLNTVPINVQSPASCAHDLARGFTGEVHTGDKNTIQLFSSPGFVEYTEDRCGAPGQEDPRDHPERGLSSDIQISTEVPIHGYWYLSADAGEVSPFGVDGDPSAGAMPCVTVRMQMWTERHPGTGTLIAQGTTTKSVVSTPAEAEDAAEALQGLVPDVCEGSEGTIDPEKVTEFQVTLEPESDLRIPEIDGYVILVQWYQHDEGDPDEGYNLMQREWNLHTGSKYANRIVMAVEDSIRIDEMRLQPFNEKLWAVAEINTPWGSYDVDTENIRLQLFDEEGEELPMEHLEEPHLDYSVNHGGHYDPVNAAFPWDYQNEELEPGDYTIRLTTTNWQHTSDAVAEADFTVRDDLSVDPKKGGGPVDPVKDSPLPPIWLVVVLVLLPVARALGRQRTV